MTGIKSIYETKFYCDLVLGGHYVTQKRSDQCPLVVYDHRVIWRLKNNKVYRVEFFFLNLRLKHSSLMFPLLVTWSIYKKKNLKQIFPWNPWLAQYVEHATLNCRLVSSSPMLGVYTLKKSSPNLLLIF